MIKNIIFDLSEVIINGLLGIEKVLCERLSIPEDKVMECFWGSLFEDLMIGNIPEERYLNEVIKKEGWNIEPSELKAVIRNNFHIEVEGVIPVVMELSRKYKLYLLSDHSREWVQYIKSVHPFLKVFEKVFFSYELKKTKKDPSIFTEILDKLSLRPEECLFIDDHERNINNARTAGIDGIRFINADQMVKELKKRRIL